MVSPGINKSIKVPKLIIFSFTESALKKGILSGVSTGKISITIDDANKQGVYISITDDGMHRNLSNSKQAYSKNMMMMEQVVAYFNTFNTKHISIQVLDNGTELKPMGSTVEIFIPAEYNYQL
jgi:LytS/YehU family sensor histidine kinase